VENYIERWYTVDGRSACRIMMVREVTGTLWLSTGDIGDARADSSSYQYWAGAGSTSTAAEKGGGNLVAGSIEEQ
jgi:hypothetical protein